MASRYGRLTRSVRSAVQTSSRRTPSSTRTPFSTGAGNPLRSDNGNAAFRRRFSVISRLPVELGSALHGAAAEAKLVSHLSVNSQTRSAISLGLHGYVNSVLSNVP